MLYFLICMCSVFCAITIILCIILMRNKDKIQELNKKLAVMNFFQREFDRLKNQISILDKKDVEKLKQTPLQISNVKRDYNGMFEGKKAIVGNYDNFFAKETRKMLMLFGLSVEIVSSGIDLYDKISNGCKYDIIFTNNIYQVGYDGPTLLKNLKSLDNFNTPVVIHTVSHGQRELFMDRYGFDEYIEKPVTYEELERVLKKFFA